MKFSIKTLCIMLVATLCLTAVFMLGFSQNSVAEAADPVVVVYPNWDFSGTSTAFYSGNNPWYEACNSSENHSVKFFASFSIQNSPEVTTNVYLDLNGKTLSNQSITLSGGGEIYDKANYGACSFAVKSTTRDTLYKGNANTMCFFDVASGAKFTVLSGKIKSLRVNKGKVNSALPSGYCFVAHNKDTNKDEFYTYAAGETDSFDGTTGTYTYLYVQKCNHEQFKDGLCLLCNKTLSEQEEFEALKYVLNETKAELVDAINKKADQTTVDESVRNLQHSIDLINNTLTALGKKDTELEQAIEDAKTEVSNAASQALEKAKTELTTKINAKADKADVDESIDDLHSAINTINNTLTALGDKDGALEQAIEKAKTDVSTAATKALEDAKTELTTAINTKASQADVDEAIQNLQNSIDTINNTLTALGKKDADLEQAIEDAKTEAINTASQALEKAKTELTTAIDTKANKTDVDKAVADLNSAIATINGTLKTLGDKDGELEQAIEKAKTDVSTAATKALEDAKTELTTAINTKASQADVDEAIQNLQNSIDTINNTLTALGNKDADLEQAIEDAKTEAINTASQALEKAKTELTTAIDTKANKTDVDKAVADLNNSITTINSLLETLKAKDTDLEQAIEKAKTDVSTAATKALEDAKTELTTAINTKASQADVDEAIQNLQNSIDTINSTLTALGKKDADLEQAIEDAKAEAINTASQALEKAKTELTEAISKKANQADVDKAVADLNSAIATINGTLKTLGDKDGELEQAIEKAKTDVSNAASEALENAKTELVNKINAKADQSAVDESVTNLNNAIDNINNRLNQLGAHGSELDEAVEKAKTDVANAAQKALDEAKTELTTKIDTKANTDDVNEAIKRLTAAIENAKTANDKYVEDTNVSLKSNLTTQIEEADTALEDAINKLSARLDSAENQIAENKEEIKTLKSIVLAAWVVMFALGVVAVVMVFGFRKIAKLCVANSKNDSANDDSDANEADGATENDENK